MFFDVDGVLLDSLPQHLKFCADKAREYGLMQLAIPSPAELRQMVRSGVAVSPMLNMLLAVGFPPPLAQRAVEDYERQFMANYRPEPFPGIEPMLKRVAAAGLPIGLVTSNTRLNVEPALGSAMSYFDRRCRFYFDNAQGPAHKPDRLREGAEILRLPAAQCVYVGDQPSDVTAAEAAGFMFLGVSYGWGLAADDASIRVADDVPTIADTLIDHGAS